MNISINNSCIVCKKCIRVCPAEVFGFDTMQSRIHVEFPENCINCGHCVAICPTDSVVHEHFPEEKLHAVDASMMPSPGQLSLLIRSRRSNRAFSSKPVPVEYLEQILDAAHRAPTASNSRTVSYTVVTNPEKLKFISDYTIEGLTKLIKPVKILKPVLKLLIPQAVKAAAKIQSRIAAYHKGEDTILRGAKAVILFHTPKHSRFGMQDANLAYQNASLMAESLGVAQFYTGYVCTVKNKKKLCQELGISGEIQAGMALSIPAFRFEKYVDRDPVQVNWVKD